MIEALLDFKRRLLALEDVEDRSHAIWNHVASNLIHGYLSQENRQALYATTGTAVELHGQAMNDLRTLYADLEGLSKQLTGAIAN